jgi:molecular chaperone GrpE
MPLVHGIIRLHDDLGKVLDSSRQDASSLSPERLIRSIEAFREDLEELLSDNGLSTYQVPDGPFDPHRQRALRTVSTPDPSLVGQVAEKLRPGFERISGIVVKERVVVYVAAPTEIPGRGDAPDGKPSPDLYEG